ncbi:zinc finger, NFX1-type containing 1, putative [Acanthamoeba castellanii str. Neff]|uniref:Zinc finger, NFX1-type containing 1, putative n=1 Tax=Acanthamoeba castellanii (strain ATCC 30010 / Neff) TaxID=1257118 RepID=L8GS61_ACACF|nr:zinc finger, NFX1-type containing 1, putative [Acanthamoeba castellanii str. Neff]ELR14966.1 zinc finger, NFX1-type containing 1, putative [Acanthamoeba castellanii str. Neff]
MEGTYVMAESSAAYFEAYRHVLLALKNIIDDALPFQRYLLRLSNEIRPPSYFDQESTLDFSLLKRGYVEPPPPKQLPAGRRQDRGDPLPARNPANSWPVLQPWPTFDSGLNESQLQAVRQALTNELALIQGPPGTGKTFVGLKIARLLLQTRQRTAPPILCVCYTNHALDQSEGANHLPCAQQFLEGIYKFEKNVVRIGGRSSSTILGERNIMKLQLPYGHRLLGARWNIKRSQDEVSHAIVQCLENLRKERLSLSDLKKVAFPHHLRSLCEGREEADEASSAMLLDRWLELPKKKRRQKGKGKAKVNGAATAQTNRFQRLADLQEDVATTKNDKGKEKLGDESEDEDEGEEEEGEEDFVDEQLQEGAVSIVNVPGGNEEEEEDDEAEEEGDEEEIRQIEEERALLEAGEAGGKKEPQVQVVNFADLTEDEKMPSPALLETLDLWSLRYEDRARLHFFWLRLMGFYCIGNAKLLQDNSPLWRRVMATLRDQGCAGAALSLACQKHPQTNIVVAKAADFAKAPMGGCMLKCDSRLPCGHACTLNCHPDDSLHEEIKCYSKCAKKRECQHACPLKCWQECGDCRVRVLKTLPCGHTTSQPCYLAPELCVCDYACTKGLPCGHNAVVPCHQAYAHIPRQPFNSGGY